MSSVRKDDQVSKRPYDSDGRPVEMATDLVLEKDRWRVLLSRAVESGLGVTEEVRRYAEKALSDAQDRWDHLEAPRSGVVDHGRQRTPVWRRLFVRRRGRNGSRLPAEAPSICRDGRWWFACRWAAGSPDCPERRGNERPGACPRTPGG